MAFAVTTRSLLTALFFLLGTLRLRGCGWGCESPCEVTELMVGDVKRFYSKCPFRRAGSEPLPIAIYFHGGGDGMCELPPRWIVPARSRHSRGHLSTRAR